MNVPWFHIQVKFHLKFLHHEFHGTLDCISQIVDISYSQVVLALRYRQFHGTIGLHIHSAQFTYCLINMVLNYYHLPVNIYNSKVLADSVGLRSRLVKGQEYTGSSDVAMNFVKFDDGR